MYLKSFKQVVRLVLAAALAGFALVATTPGTADAAAVACQRTFTSTTGLDIPDNRVVHSFIDVPEDGLVVSDVDVFANIRHTFDVHLTIVLGSDWDDGFTRGEGVLLFKESGGDDDDLRGTVWDDEATTSIAAGIAPFTGRFRPETPLAPVRGFAGGRYHLSVFDDSQGETGTVDGWGVTLRYAACDLDADGVEDHRDQCPELTGHTASGCPATTRKVSTTTYRAGKFKGALSSPVAGCRESQGVTVWKVRPGPDRRVGTATTRADGSWRLARTKRHGRYYATSAALVVPDAAECPAVVSPRLRIR